MNAIVKLSSKNQITIPVAVTRKLKAIPGTIFDLKVVNGKLELEQLAPLESFFGKYATKKNSNIDPVKAVKKWRENHEFEI